MKVKNCIKVILLVAACLLSENVFAQSITKGSTLDVQLVVAGCNNNLICEINLGETIASCPLDCPDLSSEATTSPDMISASQTLDDSSTRSGATRVDARQQTVIDGGTVVAQDFTVSPGIIDVSISWYTPLLTISSVRIGYSDDFSVAAAAEFGYRNDHFFKFTNLIPNQQYLFEVLMSDSNGLQQRIIGQFKTDAPESISIVQNTALEQPSEIKVILEDSITTLIWKNSTQSSFEFVRVVRTLENPAQNPEDGIMIYEGRAEKIQDTGLVSGQLYYYTFFAKHDADMFARPVFVEVRYIEDELLYVKPETFEPVFGDDVFNMFHFSFSQAGKPLVWTEKQMLANPGEDITIRFPKKDLFDPLDDMYIDIIVYDENNEPVRHIFQKFIFKTESSFYETVISNLLENQTLFFTIKRVSADNVEASLAGKISIGEYNLEIQNAIFKGSTCRGFATGFTYLKNSLFCTPARPVAVLIICLIPVLWYIRTTLRNTPFSVLKKKDIFQ